MQIEFLPETVTVASLFAAVYFWLNSIFSDENSRAKIIEFIEKRQARNLYDVLVLNVVEKSVARLLGKRIVSLEAVSGILTVSLFYPLIILYVVWLLGYPTDFGEIDLFQGQGFDEEMEVKVTNSIYLAPLIFLTTYILLLPLFKNQQNFAIGYFLNPILPMLGSFLLLFAYAYTPEYSFPHALLPGAGYSVSYYSTIIFLIAVSFGILYRNKFALARHSRFRVFSCMCGYFFIFFLLFFFLSSAILPWHPGGISHALDGIALRTLMASAVVTLSPRKNAAFALYLSVFIWYSYEYFALIYGFSLDEPWVVSSVYSDRLSFMEFRTDASFAMAFFAVFALPLINGFVDFISVSFTRLFIKKIRSDKSALKVAYHIALDITVAILALLTIAFAMALSVEIVSRVLDVDISWNEMGLRASQDPWGDGLAVTLILITTFIPTLVHLLLGALAIIVFLPMGQYITPLLKGGGKFSNSGVLETTENTLLARNTASILALLLIASVAALVFVIYQSLSLVDLGFIPIFIYSFVENAMLALGSLF